MIALTINNYVWNNLRLDTALDALYDKYRTLYGSNFKPFFPVADNLAGESSWGSECYVLYDPIVMPSSGDLQQQEQVMYTLVGPIPELFDFKSAIVDQFDHLTATRIVNDGYRITDISVWQSGGTVVRDKLRDLYSLIIVLQINYIKC
jgi:hypothetical protein